MHIRAEKPSDIEAVYRVNAAAFEREAEAKLVDALRSAGGTLVSLVAEEAGEIVGHALFTPVTIAGFEPLSFLALGPIGVLPDHQKQGVGTSLIEAGLEICREQGCAAVFVLGHPGYYPRFGFVPSTRFGIDSEFGVPEEVFMALALQAGALDEVSGTVVYQAVFKQV